MALDGRSQLHKCILFLINIVFGLIGFAIMVLGMWVRFSAQTIGIFNVDLNTTSIVTVVTLLIILGLMMMVISAFGNFGACKESNCALIVFWSLPGFSSEVMRNILDQSISHLANFFSFLISFFSVTAIASYEITKFQFVVLLSFLLTFTIAAGTLAIVKSEEVGKLLSDAYTTTYAQYVDKVGDPSMAIMLQFFHNMFDCCGILGSIEPVVRETCPKKGFLDSFSVPILALICSIFLRKGISSSSDDGYNITASTTVQGIPLGKTPKPCSIIPASLHQARAHTRMCPLPALWGLFLSCFM